jgi:hypothetical protein
MFTLALLGEIWKIFPSLPKQKLPFEERLAHLQAFALKCLEGLCYSVRHSAL